MHTTDGLPDALSGIEQTPGRRLVFYALIAAAYVALSLFSFRLPVPLGHTTAIWLPAGLAVALLLIWGRPALPGLILGIGITALLLTYSLFAQDVARGFLQWLLLGVVNLLEPLVIIWLYRRAAGQQSPLQHYTAFLWLLGAITVGCLAAAIPYISLDLRPQASPVAPLNLQLLGLWMADFLGILVVAPLFVAHWQQPHLHYLMKRPLEWLLWLSGLICTALASANLAFEAIYLILPLMVWAATRFSLSGSMLAISAAALVALAQILGSQQQTAVSSGNFLLEEALVLAMTCVSCYVRTLLEDRRRVETSLENTVEERTRELQLMNFELRDEIFVRQQAEKSFRRSSRHYRALVETASNPIIVIDEHCSIRQWNGAAESLFGYGREDAKGLNLLDAFTPPSHQDEMAWKITKVLTSGVLKESIETEAYSFDGTGHTMLWNINLLPRDDDDEPPQVILIGQDITEIRETQDKLHYLAHYDALTGTANRRLFEDRCRQAIESALRYGHCSALVSLDIDYFKRINDTLGHDAGDELLKAIADRLRSCVRREDTIARLGGDEFAVLLNKVSGAEGCEKVARNILEAIVEPILVRGGELVITSSIGITLAPIDGTQYEDLLKNADMAMYRAKKAGRNNIQFFSQDMNEDLQRQLQMEQDLREAIQAGDLDLYYQPVVDAQTREIVAMEALLRWRHAEQGLLAPEQFLDVAEQTGQLLNLGEWAFYNACLQARAIQTMSPRPVLVSINISSRQYSHPQMPQVFERIMRETRVDPHLLCLEIDERLLNERPDESAMLLHSLKALGIQLVLDRFGSGLSSIRLLRDLPFDQVKIDRGLLADVPEDANACAIVRTLVNLARQLSLAVTATGVETADQEMFLRQTGCTLAQGHRFCAPIPSHLLAATFHEMRSGAYLRGGEQIDLPLLEQP